MDNSIADERTADVAVAMAAMPRFEDGCINLQELLRQHLDQFPEDVHSIYQLSCYLLPRLKECGYSGSERTLRNYLHTNPSVKAIFEKGISTHDQDQKLE